MAGANMMCSAVREQADKAALLAKLARQLVNMQEVPVLGSFFAVDWAFMNCHVSPLWSYIFPYCHFPLESRMVSDFLLQVSSSASSSSVLLWAFYFYFSTCMSQWSMITASQELTENAPDQHDLPFVKTGARAYVGPLCMCFLILSTWKLTVQHLLEPGSKSASTGKVIWLQFCRWSL